MRRASCTWYLLLALAIAETVAPSARQGQSTASALSILQKVDLIRAPAQSFTFDLTLTIYSGSTITSVNRFSVRVKDAEKSLVRFTEPPKIKGRAILMNGENTWIYIPGTRGALRISAQQRLLGP